MSEPQPPYKEGETPKLITKRRGVNVDEKIRSYFRVGYNLYLTGRAQSLRNAYHQTLVKFFSNGEVQDEVVVPILPPSEELPSYDQFLYWWRKEKINLRGLGVPKKIGQITKK